MPVSWNSSLIIVAFASTLLANPKVIAVFSTTTTFELRDSIIIDSGANQHIYNDLSHIYNIEDTPSNNIFAGRQTEGPILNVQKQGIMRVNIKTANPKAIAAFSMHLFLCGCEV